ncbi:thymus-specific serine protease-like [Hoplias malabaricus]|uniref:thymus-specific serine protease-like n=1 Tax=Hoplias malabaricus TaxID=27720 RepID=UPI003461DA49
MALSQCLMMTILFIHSSSSGRLLWKMKVHVHEVQEQRAREHLKLHSASMEQAFEGNMEQPLDHFNHHKNSTFTQRFFVNKVYWKCPYGPVFLYIGGEGPLTQFSVLAGHHVSMAKKHGALLVALEHRFYGQSIVPGGLEIQNLQYLSSQQALADLAAFHLHISEKFSLTCRNIWISFGGSYAGALSAWFRGKFPHLVFGAVASSAPVQAKLDFSAYNTVVGHSLLDESVGGSDKCVEAVREAFSVVEAALFGGNETRVGKDFDCCETPKSPEDRTELLQVLADIFLGTVQYNEEVGPLTVAYLCDIMTNQSDEGAYRRLVKLTKIYLHTLGHTPCLDVSRGETISELNRTSDSRIPGYRQWFYQTCSEFGFYQTCEDASCPFSRRLTLQTQTQLCPLLFNIPQSTLPANIHFTNQYYGGEEPRTQQVLYVNGDIDPWMALSIVRNGTSDDHRAILIHSSAHCADMNPATTRDRLSLTHARQEIERCVSVWLKRAELEHRI